MFLIIGVVVGVSVMFVAARLAVGFVPARVAICSSLLAFEASDFLNIMIEIHEKIMSLRDIIDLSLCNSSASLREIVLKTLEDLQKIYLAIIPKKEVAKIKDKSTDQVFSMLDTSRLYHAAATCKLFRNWAKYPFCYSHIDLRTPVPKVNDALVATIIHRAGKALRCPSAFSTG
ncbi:F-box protein [Arachis hypogaea]|nr:F-box protein [Arachis hypogaea]